VPEENKRAGSWKNPSSAICEGYHGYRSDVCEKKGAQQLEEDRPEVR